MRVPFISGVPKKDPSTGGSQEAILMSGAMHGGRDPVLQDMQDVVESYSRGLEYLDYNEPDQAIAAFTNVLRHNPRHVHAYFARGYAWAERGDLDQAIADYSEAIRLDPGYAAAYFNRAAAYHRKGDSERAAADEALYKSLKNDRE
jgi:tetratricopeptide (TPR) repeat protein